MIRKDHLHPRKALWWIAVSIAIALLGLFPKTTDWVAGKLGVDYPPTILFVVAFLALLIKLLRLDIARTREQQTVLILSQRVSILEKRLEDIENDDTC
ncbi:MAG: hypothetical protein DHS20C09_19110 [marine bacterium B5-7]|nr:MAG: hypothetical protein DHS20C09_19110 [marine bacterium B5-7]